MKILVLCDDYWHPAEVLKRGLAFLTDTHELDFIQDAKDILTPAFLRRYDLVINAKMNELNAANHTPWIDNDIAEVQVKDLKDYVEEGYGFLSLHAGNAWCWEKDLDRPYCEFIGNAFVKHPPRCNIDMKMAGTHPITNGVAPFSVRDEHYELNHFANDITVIMEGTSAAGGTQPSAYVRSLGKGRICVLVPGHLLSVFENPEYQKLIRQAILWCHKDI